MSAPVISLVIPLYNECESLPALLTDIRAVAGSLPHTVEVVFVDDGSTDGSWGVVRDLAASDPSVRGVRFRRNFGKAAALQAGFDATRGEIVLTLDADLQDDPHEIPRFLAAIEGGLDVVSGWKKVRHDPWHKVFPSRVFNGLVSRVAGVRLHDHNCGFKAYRRAVLAEVRLYGELHRFVPVLAASRGFKVGELIVQHRSRRFGRSKFGWQRFVKGFLDLVQVRFVTAYGNRPLHWLGGVALVLGACGTASAVLGVALWAFAPSPTATLAAFLIAAVLALLAGQALLSGLVTELLVSRTAAAATPFAISETIR